MARNILTGGSYKALLPKDKEPLKQEYLEYQRNMGQEPSANSVRNTINTFLQRVEKDAQPVEEASPAPPPAPPKGKFEFFLDYARKINNQLLGEGFRSELDDRNETLQAKIRDAQLEKIPYMLIIGDKEEKAAKVAVRLRDGKDLGQIKLNKFICLGFRIKVEI